MTDRPLVSPGESTRVKLAVISASFVASSTSSDLTNLARNWIGLHWACGWNWLVSGRDVLV
jgi:hypothetical protein